MTWPEAVYKIIIDGGGGLLTAIVLLALWTDFWEDLFKFLDRRRHKADKEEE